MARAWIWERLKSLAARAMRPGLAPIHERLDAVAKTLRDGQLAASWRGGLEGGLIGGSWEIPELAEKYRRELEFWQKTVKIPGSHPAIIGPFEEVFGAWQRQRLRELGQWLGLADDAAMAGWCRERSVVEVGGGPYPAVAAGRWKRAVAVDPLADGFAAEDLLPSNKDEFVSICSPGERLPLPGGSFDLAICENCLDHVVDPGAVAAEMERVLRPGGLLWLLVDLMEHRDALHPHPMEAQRLKRLLRDAGFQVVRERDSEHKSHPEAKGEWRGLLRKTGAG
jgi:SAM-dependent methyltransferase